MGRSCKIRIDCNPPTPPLLALFGGMGIPCRGRCLLHLCSTFATCTKFQPQWGLIYTTALWPALKMQQIASLKRVRLFSRLPRAIAIARLALMS